MWLPRPGVGCREHLPALRPRETGPGVSGSQLRALSGHGRKPSVWPTASPGCSPSLLAWVQTRGAAPGREGGKDREHTSHTHGAVLSGGSEDRPGASAPRRGQKTLCGGAWCGLGTRSIFLECEWMCREAGAAPRRATRFRATGVSPERAEQGVMGRVWSLQDGDRVRRRLQAGRPQKWHHHHPGWVAEPLSRGSDGSGEARALMEECMRGWVGVRGGASGARGSGGAGLCWVWVLGGPGQLGLGSGGGAQGAGTRGTGASAQGAGAQGTGVSAQGRGASAQGPGAQGTGSQGIGAGAQGTGVGVQGAGAWAVEAESQGGGPPWRQQKHKAKKKPVTEKPRPAPGGERDERRPSASANSWF